MNTFLPGLISMCTKFWEWIYFRPYKKWKYDTTDNSRHKEKRLYEIRIKVVYLLVQRNNKTSRHSSKFIISKISILTRSTINSKQSPCTTEARFALGLHFSYFYVGVCFDIFVQIDCPLKRENKSDVLCTSSTKPSHRRI